MCWLEALFFYSQIKSRCSMLELSLSYFIPTTAVYSYMYTFNSLVLLDSHGFSSLYFCFVFVFLPFFHMYVCCIIFFCLSVYLWVSYNAVWPQTPNPAWSPEMTGMHQPIQSLISIFLTTNTISPQILSWEEICFIYVPLVQYKIITRIRVSVDKYIKIVSDYLTTAILMLRM